MNRFDSFLRFDVSMKDPVPVHMLDGLQQLVDVVLHSRLRQVVRPPLNGFIQVHLHELEYEGQATGGLVTMRLESVRTIRCIS